MPPLPEEWTTEQVARWLRAKRVPASAIAVIEQNEVVGEDLLEFDVDELVGLGIEDAVASEIESAITRLASGEDEHAASVSGEPDPSSWSPSEVEAWALSIPDIARLAPKLVKSDVDGGDLLEMTLEDAVSLGLTAFKARKLIKRVKELMGEGETPSAPAQQPPRATPGARATPRAPRRPAPGRAPRGSSRSAPEYKTPEPEPEPEPQRPTWGPGLHVVPHQVVVIDRELAMEENPLFKASDFTSLKGPTGVAADASLRGGELRTILVVGATGAGKSTMINSMVNYLYQVRYEDPFRLKLIQEPPTAHRKSHADSQTNQVFGYLLDTPPALGGKDSLLIIDTPGFGDSRGVARDEKNIEEIKKFFEQEVPYLHAVCFVIKAPDCRMTHVQKWIFDKILGLFGKDIEDIITLLFTFSDAQDPPALAAVQSHGISYREMFKLNNSAYFLADKTASSAGSRAAAKFNAMFWELGHEAFAEFCGFVRSQSPQSLTKTRQVLKRREELKYNITYIRGLVEQGLSKLNELEQTIAMIIKNETLIKSNRKFTFSVTEYKREQRSKPPGTYVTVCNTCQWTCHKSCGIPNDGDKNGCWAMTNGYCRICPKKCHWSGHKNTPYYWERVSYQVSKTNDELKARYVKATSTKSQFEQILDGSRKEFEQVQTKVFYGITQVREAVNELQKIALRPNTFHSDEYFDLMVEQERNDKKKGWQQRVKAIKELKERSKALAQLTAGDYDPFKAQRERLMQDARKGEVSTDKTCLVM